jgi:hypothetical protein
MAAASVAAPSLASAPVDYTLLQLLCGCCSCGDCSHGCYTLRSCYVTAAPVAAFMAAIPVAAAIAGPHGAASPMTAASVTAAPAASAPVAATPSVTVMM